MQLSSSAPAYWPAEHPKQFVAPVERPVAHTMQLAIPSLSWYLPAAQLEHAPALSLEYLPSLQSLHTEAPAPEYLPGEHFKQAEELPEEAVPAAQSEQKLAPAAEY